MTMEPIDYRGYLITALPSAYIGWKALIGWRGTWIIAAIEYGRTPEEALARAKRHIDTAIPVPAETN